jgi:hypothetical protein
MEPGGALPPGICLYRGFVKGLQGIYRSGFGFLHIVPYLLAGAFIILLLLLFR